MQPHLVSESNVDLYVANIKSCYYQALQYPSLAEVGLSWYATAYSQAQAIAKRFYLVSELRVCGVVAALSPNNRWERNLIDAENMIRCAIAGGKPDAIKVGTYHHNRDKAWMIAKGYDAVDVLGGNKVRSFYNCLISPHHSQSVCVDAHAINIALGRQAIIARTPTLSDSKYTLIASCYTQATQEINEDSLTGTVLPLQVQALTWTYYRVMRKIDARFSIDI